MTDEELTTLVIRTKAARPLTDDLVDRWCELQDDDPAAAEEGLVRMGATHGTRLAFAMAGRHLRRR